MASIIESKEKLLWLYPQNLQNQIIEDYIKNNLKIRDMKKKYAMADKTIHCILEFNNISKRSRKAGLLSINENYFENIDTPDKAYFLGFITSDGHITKPKRGFGGQDLSINLCEIDLHILQEFKGVTHNKSYDCKIPTSIPPKLIRHYLRGLIDGDGGWTFDKFDHKIDQLILHFCGSLESFVSQVQDVLIKECFLEKKTVISSKNNTYFQFRYGGNQQCLKIFHYLYDDGGPWLHRKYEKAKQHLESIGLL